MSQEIELEDIAHKICRNESLEFVKKVGQGTLKETFHIGKLKSGESFALKIYRPKQINERPQREIDAMQRCDHPNIAKLYSCYTYITTRRRNFFIVWKNFLQGEHWQIIS